MTRNAKKPNANKNAPARTIRATGREMMRAFKDTGDRELMQVSYSPSATGQGIHIKWDQTPKSAGKRRARRSPSRSVSHSESRSTSRTPSRTPQLEDKENDLSARMASSAHALDRAPAEGCWRRGQWVAPENEMDREEAELEASRIRAEQRRVAEETPVFERQFSILLANHRALTADSVSSSGSSEENEGDAIVKMEEDDDDGMLLREAGRDGDVDSSEDSRSTHRTPTPRAAVDRDSESVASEMIEMEDDERSGTPTPRARTDRDSESVVSDMIKIEHDRDVSLVPTEKNEEDGSDDRKPSIPIQAPQARTQRDSKSVVSDMIKMEEDDREVSPVPTEKDDGVVKYEDRSSTPTALRGTSRNADDRVQANVKAEMMNTDDDDHTSISTEENDDTIIPADHAVGRSNLRTHPLINEPTLVLDQATGLPLDPQPTNFHASSSRVQPRSAFSNGMYTGSPRRLRPSRELDSWYHNGEVQLQNAMAQVASTSNNTGTTPLTWVPTELNLE